jgi:hypothetical protein
MPSRNINPNAVKIHRAYNSSELARCLHVHKNTIGNWQRSGLNPIDDGKPALFMGRTVREFLRKRSAARKCPSPPGSLYCFRCRMPRQPNRAVVEYEPITATSGNLRGFCPTCETPMFRCIARSALATKMPGIEVQFGDAPARLMACPSPSLDCDLRRKAVV